MVNERKGALGSAVNGKNAEGGHRFSHLLSPIRIGGLELKNRMVMASIHLGYASEDGFITERIKEFYRRRAQGGVGLIVLGMGFVDRAGSGGLGARNVVGLADDGFIQGLRELTDAVHEYGTPIAAQLYHAGRYSYSSVTGTQPVSASSIPCRLNREVARELSTEEVGELVDKFAAAAWRAKNAGFDAVEIGGSAGYLINQFLSPYTNKRTDRYGGNLARRLTFVLEIVDAIRDAVGKEFPLIYRTCGSDFVDGGLSLGDYKVVAQALERAGVDAISVTAGWHEARVPEITNHTPRGGFVYLAEGIKDVVRIPVMVSNRINEPLLAEEILRYGKADLIVLGRPLLADPDFPCKVEEERPEDIRPCIACNRCLDDLLSGVPIRCTVNAQTGKEEELKVVPTDKGKRVAVIGAGVAGMEAALVAKRRGHHVTLYERSPSLGGQLQVAALPPDKEELGCLLGYYERQIRKAGIKLKLAAEITAQQIVNEGFDDVVLATGAKPRIPPIEGLERSKVFFAEEVLKGEVLVGSRIVIVGGGRVGCETALFLAHKMGPDAKEALFSLKYTMRWEEVVERFRESGKRITILEQLPKIGGGVGPSTRWIMLDELQRYGVTVVTNACVQAVDDEGVHILRDGKKIVIPADTVIIACGYEPTNKLYQKLEEAGGTYSLHCVGDCKEVRSLMEAIHEGFSVGCDL